MGFSYIRGRGSRGSRGVVIVDIELCIELYSRHKINVIIVDIIVDIMVDVIVNIIVDVVVNIELYAEF